MCQAPSGPSFTNTSGITGCTGSVPKARPGLGVSARISPIMSAMSSASTPQIAHSAAVSRRATRSRRASSACIAGSRRSLAFSWMRRHSARSRAATPTGSNPCKTRKHVFHAGARSAQALGHLVEFDAQIARLVHRIDQRQAYQPLLRRQRRDGELFLEMILQRAARGDGGFQAVILAFEALAAAHRGPVGQRRRRHRRLAAVVFVLVRGIQILRPGEILARQRGVKTFGLGGYGLDRFTFGHACRRAFVALEQRVLLDLRFAIFGELDVRLLQLLDRLLQLGRHDERLPLPDFETLPQRHDALHLLPTHNENFSPR